MQACSFPPGFLDVQQVRRVRAARDEWPSRLESRPAAQLPPSHADAVLTRSPRRLAAGESIACAYGLEREEGGCRERIRTAHRTAPRNRTHPSRLRPASQPLFTSYASTRGSTTDSSSSRRPPYWIPRRQIQRTGRSGLSAGARRQRSLRQHWRRPQSLALDRRQTEGDRVGSGYRRRRGGSAPAKRTRSGRDCALRCSSRPTKSANPFLRIHSQSPGSASRRR